MVMPWSYTLTPDEVREVNRHARKRARRAYGRDTTWSTSRGDQYERTANALAGELAVARMLDGRTDFDGGWHSPDVMVGPQRVEVRNRALGGDLALHTPGTGANQDDPRLPFVLTHGARPGPIVARGWLFGREGQRDEYRHTGPGVRRDSRLYWVPVRALRSMWSLREWLDARRRGGG
jgi:hypothetical protein